MDHTAAVFKALSDPTRLRLAVLLAVRGETCVCALAEALDAPDFKISRHLGILRAAGLVQARREGTWMYYQLAKPRNLFEEQLHQGLRDYLANEKSMKADFRRLAKASCYGK